MRDLMKEQKIAEAVLKKAEALTAELRKHTKNEKLISTFEKCFMTTAKTTMQCLDDEVFLITGDIEAMWLRDSSAQVIHYLPFAGESEEIAEMIRGLLKRQFKYISIDPYANAFNAAETGTCFSQDETEMSAWDWERKFEIDSLCYPVKLLSDYIRITKDASVLTDDVMRTLGNIVELFEREQCHMEKSAYHFDRPGSWELDRLPNEGKGAPVTYTGMIWSGFRPSDDRCTYGYNIPENLMAVSALNKIREIAKMKKDAELSQKAGGLAAVVEEGVMSYGTAHNEKGEKYFLYEVDGVGRSIFMDDANVPSLLALPLISSISKKDPLYLATRERVLSEKNPYFFEGKYAKGVGSPHTLPGYVWPIALTTEALTTEDETEKNRLIETLLATDAGTNAMHESFNPDDPTQFSREWFAWADSLFSFMVMDTFGLIENEEDVVNAGVHNYSREDRYVVPEDPEVLNALECFKDRKLALMMHWGLYSQLGIVESWALSDEDGDWSRNDIDWTKDGKEFKKQYFELNKTFNPIRFKPEDWAAAAADAGFKYFIFTTKHHDGFCMWDTKYTDYKITGSECPFRENKYADVLKHAFNEMRAKGLGITAYFSKADWGTPLYWENPIEDFQGRGPSYNPVKDSERWGKFTEYTTNQINELCDDYGPIDALWFDAGWVRKESGQDIKLGEIIENLRKRHPGLISVDRTIGGPYENYVTPEQCVPDEPLLIPWESCITMGTSFSFKYEDDYKTPRQVIALLADIVCKGGNLALNVGPQPDGRIPAGALKTMKGMGEWLRKYGEAIYGTRVCAPYKKNDICFTKKGEYVYAIKCYRDENPKVLNELVVPIADEFKKVVDLFTGKEVPFVKTEEGIKVTLPRTEDNAIAQVLRLEK